MNRLRKLVVGAAALLALAAAPPQPAAEQRLRAHVEFLASDLLEGRDTGQRGHAIAAAYVASEFRKLGLTPGGGGGGWYLPVPLRRATHASAPALTYVAGGRSWRLVSGREFGLRPSLLEKDRSIDAELVFAGHGISDPALRIDEYAGLDVRGKIVVALSGSPDGLPGDVAAHLESAKQEVAARKGAVGFIEIGYELSVPGRTGPIARRDRAQLNWVDAAGRAGTSTGAVRADLAVSPEWGQRLFQGARKSLAAVRAESLRPIAGFPLPGRMRIQAKSAWQDFTSPQVIGVLPGSDPRLAAEHVVLMGHLDHMGVKTDAKPGEDAIYNGAIDNAGGIATMLEAARTFVSSGKRPRRSVMFVANTGEERGLLGAEYLASHSTVPIDRIVALVNVDMPLLLYDFSDVVGFGAEHSTLGRNVAAAARSMNLALTPDPMPEQALFTRSDHYPFVKRGVPSVFLMTGHANGGKRAWDDFLVTVYHTPKDDLSQPINWRAGARFAELNYRIARALADAPEAPLWYRGSYFGDAFAAGKPKAPR